MSPPSNGSTNLGGPDPTTATDFLKDLLNAATNLGQEQVARWSNTFLKMREGTYTASQLQIDISRMWDPWFAMTTFPLLWWTNYSQQVPTLLLVVDPAAETAGPAEAPLNVSAPVNGSAQSTVTPEVEDLKQIGGTNTIEKAHIEAELTSEGNRVSVKLVELGKDPAARLLNGIHPGLFVGPVYFTEGQTRRPIALVYVFIE